MKFTSKKVAVNVRSKHFPKNFNLNYSKILEIKLYSSPFHKFKSIYIYKDKNIKIIVLLSVSQKILNLSI